MKEATDNLDQYLAITGQKRSEVFAGSTQTGMEFVYDLVDQALRDKKKVVWKTTDLETGQGEYLLEDL